jgi:uncharacterized RDD family membrane protein YckC
MSTDADASLTSAPRYARFSRRLRAMLLDWIITLAVIFGAVLVAATVGSDTLSRALGILVVVALLLYEPVLVSRMGGTLGHYLTNLRVVDERNGALSSRGCSACTPSSFWRPPAATRPYTTS